MSVRSLLARVAKLEQARTPTSPIELWYGSFETFAAECEAGIDAGIYDRLDMPYVIASVRKWMSE